MRQVTIRAPPKPVFDLLCDPTWLEEATPWRVTPLGDRFEEGFQWQEKRRLRRRVWTVTSYDRRGLSFTAQSRGVSMGFVAKKGGRASCNVQMHVEGDPKAVARFEKDGDRLEQLKRFWEG